MKKAYIIHLLTVCGGGERVCLEIASVLHSVDFEVVFVTNSGFGLRRCAELFNLPCNYSAIEVSSLLERLLSVTGRFIRYRRLLLVLKALEEILGCGVDGLIIDTSSNGAFGVDIAYIYYPVVLGTAGSQAIHWRIYNWLVARKALRFMGKPKLALANNSWTAKLVRDIYGIEAIVLHPPVDVEYFTYNGRSKEKLVVTISRLTPEKNLHFIPRVASKLPNHEWYLVGTTGSTRAEKRVSNRVLGRILSEKRKWGAENLHILTDLPRKELRELLMRASFYVHPPFSEHFGIAVVEAMASGALPIVYKDGGAWTDVVSALSSSLGYSDVSEIPFYHQVA